MKNRNTIPKIARILKVEPFKITCRWNTGETKVIDFEKLFKKWDIQKGDLDYSLTNYKVFKQVKLTDTYNLSWEPIKVDGQPYDLDPIIMYEAGEILEIPEENKISKLIKEARLKAKLSQQDLANRSGTTKPYISRLENGKVNIEMSTLTRIVETGLGMKLKISIDPENPKNSKSVEFGSKVEVIGKNFNQAYGIEDFKSGQKAVGGGILQDPGLEGSYTEKKVEKHETVKPNKNKNRH